MRELVVRVEWPIGELIENEFGYSLMCWSQQD
jgi:hypothetical protein